MHASRKRSRGNVLDTLLEKGIICIALAVVLLMAPHVLKGGTVVINTVVATISPLGWVVLVLGLLLIALHLLVLRLRRKLPHSTHKEARPSRFQHSVLPEELLNPPSRIRLEPLPRDSVPTTEPYSPSDLDETTTIPTELDGPDTTPASLAPTPPEPSLIWGPEVLRQIEWRRFEAVCQALMGQAGFQIQSQSHGADGGVDLWLHSRHARGPVALVKCRHWLRKPVGVRELREFHGLMTQHQLQRGTYITSGRYMREALEFADAQRINVLDGPSLLALIGRRRPEQQQALLAVAYEGEYWRPTCAHCSVKMVERSVADNGSAFWGCPTYPACRNTLYTAGAS
jgi:restriction system protein